MAPGEAASAQLRRLLAEIGADREVLERRHAEVERYSAAGPSAPERMAALALALDRTYTTLESILERVARNLEGGPPAGEDWHQALLANARLEIPDLRPRILGDAAWAAADELRRFRHFLRHAYGSELDPQRLARLASIWCQAMSPLRQDLDGLGDFLARLAERSAHGPA